VPRNLPDPTTLIADVAERYASMRTYRDDGDAVTKYEHGPFSSIAEHTTRDFFRTLFSRPDRFRFEFRHDSGLAAKPESEWNWYVAWRLGGKAKSWWTLRPFVEESASIFDCLGAAAGISSRTSVNVPGMLMPGGPAGSALPAPKRVDSVRREEVDGVDCLRMDGRRTEGVATTWWFDANTLLLRRIHQVTHFTKEFLQRQHEWTRDVISKAEPHGALTPEVKRRILDERLPLREFTSEATTTYRAAADVAIDDSSFTDGLPPDS